LIVPRALAALVILASSFLGNFACGTQAEAPGRVRTLLFAVDGLEWSVLLPLARAGHMPTLAGLMERGQFGRLTTTEPTFSPVIWTTIATGRGPDAHGITSFEKRGPGRSRSLFTSWDRRTKAFWNILSASGHRVDVVGWWLTHPVEEISGVMVAQTNTAMRDDVAGNRGIRKGTLIAGAAAQVHPAEREAEFFSIAREVESDLLRLQSDVFEGAAESDDAQVKSLFRASRWALRADAVYAEAGRRLAGEDADLLAIYFGGADVVGHRFWRYHEPARFESPPTPAEVEQLGDVIAAYYRYLDGVIGSILEEAGDGVRTVVVSDHGMEAFRTDAAFPAEARGAAMVTGNHLDAPPGVFIAAGPGFVPGGPWTGGLEELPVAGSVFDVLPTLLAVFEIPQGEDMPGRAMPGLDPDVLAQRPEPVPSHDTPDWQRERSALAAEPPAIGDAERRQQLRELGYIE
jgi:predicted AlkP superfamily pyrophosphatase or phosphodiesterase